MNLNRLHSLVAALQRKLGKVVWFAVNGQGMSYVSVSESTNDQRVLVNDMGMADVLTWLESEVGHDDAVLPDLTIEELQHRFDDARDRLLAERRFRNQTFPKDHPQRYAKMQEITIIIEHLVWMKDLLKPLAPATPQQQPRLETGDENVRHY